MGQGKGKELGIDDQEFHHLMEALEDQGLDFGFVVSVEKVN